MGLECATAHGLAGFGATDLHGMATGRSRAEVMIETDNPVHVGTGQIESGRNDQGSAVDVEFGRVL